ncbi:MAG: recombinase family protein [Proteobacteria bacterium]|nr:recombinase family protein [Pseudomonadota bacterium]
MIEIVDEFYSANLAQDTIRGMRENASRGYYNGSMPAMGYRIEKTKVGSAIKNKLVLDEENVPTVGRVFDLALSGMGGKEITSALNTEGVLTNRDKRWSKGVILYLLRNDVYTGTLVWGKSNQQAEPVRRNDNHPAIVSQDEFDKLQKAISERSPENCRPRSLTSDYLLSGLLRCGECGYALQGCSAKSGKFHYYVCHNSLRKGKEVCRSRMINRDRIESLVIKKLQERVLTEENLRELLRLTNDAITKKLSQNDQNIKVPQNEIPKHQRKLDNLYSAIESGSFEAGDLAARVRDLAARIEKLRNQERSLLQSTSRPLPALSVRRLKEMVKDLRELLSKGTLFEQKSFIKSFVKKITVKNGHVTIEYTYPTGGGTSSSSSGGGVLCSEQNGSPACPELRTFRLSFLLR